jgi:hypothetical protein
MYDFAHGKFALTTRLPPFFWSRSAGAPLPYPDQVDYRPGARVHHGMAAVDKKVLRALRR